MTVFTQTRLGVQDAVRRAMFTLAAIAIQGLSPTWAQTMVPGKAPGEFSVSPGGAATYRIPVQVPPGVSGMEPRLALSYNSQGGNGIMGMGWDIDGLSAITRCPKTMATDGVRGGINHNQDDRFCLDGQRLINVAGPYGATGSEYRTEIDGFSKVTANGAAAGNATNGPESFTVKDKAGLTLEYGATTDSRIEAQGKNVVRIWALNQMRDAKGNVINFSYTEDNVNGEFRINTITYAGDRKVTFTYEDRPDKFSGYEVGSKTGQHTRLSAIETSIAGNAVQRVKVVYASASSAFRSVASKVDICDPSNQCLKSLEFTSVSVGGAVTSLLAPVSDWSYDGQRWWADINGDGRQDFCRYTSRGSLLTCTVSTGGGFVDTSTSAPNFGVYLPRQWVDINGDGRQDFCRGIEHSEPGPTYYSDAGETTTVILTYPLTCAVSTGSSFVDTSTPMPDWGHSDRRWWVDINGDGRQDFCRATGKKSGVGSFLTCAVSTGSSFTDTSTPMPDWGYSDRRWWVDVNGDGIQDYCRAAGETSGVGSVLTCAMSTGNGFVDVYFTMPEWGFSDRRWWTDINGDGRQDFCRATGATSGVGSLLTCAVSTGNGFVEISTPMPDWGFSDRRWWVDVNGDGRQDFCRATGATSGVGSLLTCAMSTGTGFTDRSIPMPDWGYSDRRWWTDANGDGRQDFCRAVGASSGAGSWLQCDTALADPSTIPTLLGSVSDTRSRLDIGYESLTGPASSQFYTTDPTLVTYPVSHLQIPQKVVRSSSQGDGLGGQNVTT